MNILLDRLHQKILNNDSLMKEVTEGELLALVEVKEKATPKATKENIVGVYCSKCGHFLDGTEYYCSFCGQKIDWY